MGCWWIHDKKTKVVQKGLKIIESTNPNSNSKANYYIIKTPILHDIYMFIWRMKHRNG